MEVGAFLIAWLYCFFALLFCASRAGRWADEWDARRLRKYDDEKVDAGSAAARRDVR
jgi:hypothetical protein